MHRIKGHKLKNQFGKNRLVFVALVVTSIFPFLMFYNSGKSRSNSKVITYQLDPDSTFQVVHNFGASDAWAFQFVGKYWPMESRERISKLLFSTENATDGSPLGIGLSAWRFNIGAGSAEQGSQSEISDEWRRAECFLEADGSYNWSRQLGQQWFLQAARRYGVTDFIAFVNSPPVYFTRNAKAWSADGKEANLPSEHYGDYANFLVQVIDGMEQNAGVTFNYISPFNEPQWEWKCCGQEGSPWNNDEIARFTRILNQKLLDVDRTQTKIELSEAGQIDFLFDDQRNPVQRNNQIAEFFEVETESAGAEIRWRLELGAGLPVGAQAVVFLAFIFVFEDFVGFGYLFEFLFRGLVALVGIRMIFAGKGAVGRFNLFLGRRSIHTQGLVVVFEFNQ